MKPTTEGANLKPRRESAVLTRDDTKIWLNINLPMRRKAPHPLPSRAYFESDRRDASLMYRAQLPANRRLTALWLPSTLWADIRGGASIGRDACGRFAVPT